MKESLVHSNPIHPKKALCPGTQSIRLIARLDVKGPNLIKGVQLEGLRIVGDPLERAKYYYSQGIDELVYIDIVASLYNRNSLDQLIERTASGVFIPLTVGGGIRSVEDARRILRAGADKVAINTAAVRNPKLISEIAQQFGSQCMVLMIEAKKREGGWWEALLDSGREQSGINAVDWACQGAELGAGEIFLTSVDRDGTRKGYDLELIREVSSRVTIPVIASGGFGSVQHGIDALNLSAATAIAVADGLHFSRVSVSDIKQGCIKAGFPMRQL